MIMSKIDDIINEIIRYLDGNDHSNTPQIRATIKIYNQACIEVNEQLAESRRLIARGLLMDARRLDLEMTPPLSTRAEKLQLTDKQYACLAELCNLYNYEVPPKIDKEAVEQLLKGVDNPDKALQEQILRWRKIARTGTLADKIKTLRAILANNPEDDQIWCNNLRIVERQWVTELLNEADEALQQNDGEKLAQLYMRLTDPELQQPMPDEVLKKYQPAVKKYQQTILNKELENKRSELFSAYSSLNPELLADRLREYDLLISNPLYQADAETEQAVKEARLYLQQYQDNCRREQEFDKTLKELTAALNDHADFAIIENLYAMLRQMDLPLDQTLSMRVARRREEYLAENSRKHLRKCIYGVLTAILLLVLGGLTFTVIQRTRSYMTYRDSMEKLLANDNYDGVISLYEKIRQETPVLLQFGRLTGMKLEAERRQKLRDERFLKLKNLFNSCFSEFQKKSPRLPELQYLQKEIAQLRTDDLPQDMATQLQNINFKVRDLEFKNKQHKEAAFIAEEQNLMVQLEQFANAINNPKISPVAIRAGITGVMEQMSRISSQTADVDKKLRDERNNLIQERSKTLLGQLKNVEQRRKIIRSLQQPDTFFEFADTLQKLQSQAPDLALSSWKEALRQLPQTQSLYAGMSLGTNYLTHPALEQKISTIAFDMQNNCFVRDITMLLPDKYFAENFAIAQKKLHAELFTLYNCYEIVFLDESNTPWRFYSEEKPIFDRSYSSNMPKAIEINVIMKPGTDGYPLPIRVSYRNKKTAFYPQKISGLALPVKFIKLKNIPITSVKLPKAVHFELLEDFLRELKRAKTPEALEVCLIQMLQKLQSNDEMNIFARAALTRKTLEMLPLCSPIYAQLISESCVILDRNALHLYEKWYQPSAEVEYATTVKELKKFFKDFSPEILQKTCRFAREVYSKSQNRGLTPGGIILQTGLKKARIHWFTGADHVPEMWFYAPASAQEKPRWIIVKKSELDKGNTMSMTQFAGYNGMVFFVPFDEKNTGDLVRQIKQTRQQQQLLDFSWPDCWPQNCR